MDLSNLNLRQTIEGMPLTFNAEAAAGLNVAIQFDVSGNEPGVYHLSIANGECTFHTGPAKSPTLTVATPSDVWLKISHGGLSGQDALMGGLYSASGDLSLMLKMDALFKSAGDTTYEAPASQRPAGPIPLPGMAWMTVAFIPWILHWSTFDIPGLSHWISVGLPLLLSIMIVGYRLAFDRPTWMEWGALGFFTFSGALALTGSPGLALSRAEGYAHWGSIVSTLVMAGLWLSSLQFSKTPLSGEYSKWGFIKGLWQNSMFLYPNAVISLMWGWQFIAASALGIAALLLPEQMLILTLTRYLLLVPAFIFTSAYQKRVPISNPKLTDSQFRFWAGMGLSAVSGLLLTATMPGFDVPFIGWIALVPLLMVITTAPVKQHYVLALPFGVLLSIGVHNWYPNIFLPALGYFLILAVGTFYAGVLQLGAWLQSRLPGALKLLALPVAWSAVEFVKFIAPVVDDWWFVLLAKSMWRFPPALQILGITGFPGLSFLVMLANVSIMGLVIRQLGIRNQGIPKRASITALVVVAAVLIWGTLTIPSAPANTFTIAALTDMVVQDEAIRATGEFSDEDFGTSANPPETSRAIFDVDAALTREIAAQNPDFIVWPENEFADADDAQFIDQLKDLAVEAGSYIVADVVWNASTGMHDTALMVSPAGVESGRRAKINTTDGEENVGFVPGPLEYPVFETPYGKVGLGVCWDRHRLFITRELARSGADIVLMTVDDDFGANPNFPPFHASDGVFRAAENRVAYGLGTINGLSMVIDPYGRIMAEGEINERGVIIGETFTAPGQTLYTRFGDWFGWLMVGILGMLVVVAKR
ncbi:MAG: SCP2 sterol-binding domain-containing protein [Anaerolineales bacterium]|nr:SCP2 sterol-binding domain-containing protein [Anaerolineales bacterium]